MRKFGAISALALAAAAGSASAQISSVGPFTGPYTEGFETQVQPTPFNTCVPDRVFNNTADLCDTTGSAAHITTGWGFFCTIFPYAGARFFGSAGGPAEYRFDADVSKFGGQFGTNAGTDGGTAEFYDASGNLIGTAQITTAGCTWTWNGWESTTPFRRVKITAANGFGGGFMDMDDMEYTPAGSTGPTCYANCDGSTVVPFLNVNDFICFQAEFAAGDSYANCDASTTAPVLNVNDFICFQAKFAAGCSAP